MMPRLRLQAHKTGRADRPSALISTIVFVLVAFIVVFAGTAIVITVKGVWIDLFTR